MHGKSMASIEKNLTNHSPTAIKRFTGCWCIHHPTRRQFLPVIRLNPLIFSLRPTWAWLGVGSSTSPQISSSITSCSKVDDFLNPTKTGILTLKIQMALWNRTWQRQQEQPMQLQRRPPHLEIGQLNRSIRGKILSRVIRTKQMHPKNKIWSSAAAIPRKCSYLKQTIASNSNEATQPVHTCRCALLLDVCLLSRLFSMKWHMGKAESLLQALSVLLKHLENTNCNSASVSQMKHYITDILDNYGSLSALWFYNWTEMQFGNKNVNWNCEILLCIPILVNKTKLLQHVIYCDSSSNTIISAKVYTTLFHMAPCWLRTSDVKRT